MSYANNYSNEGTLIGDDIIVFPWKPKEIQITNDSGLKDLKYKFNESETYRTLKPYETSTVRGVSVRNLYLSTATSCAYRVWGLG